VADHRDPPGVATPDPLDNLVNPVEARSEQSVLI
jgi:hypothetical protein